MKNKIFDISKKTFFSVMIILISLLVFSIILTYVLPKGKFLETIENGEIIIHYDQYIKLNGEKGINLFKGIFAPILVLFSNDGLSILMLSLFILIITGAFQTMNDCNGMKVIVQKMIIKFKDKKKLLLALVTLIFMSFGSFFGLFEEVLTLLPLILVLTLSLGYDSYTGFLVCIIATCFGFSSALTNPFTVITASAILGISPLAHFWYRIIIFIIMYGLLLIFIFHHLKVIDNNPEKSPTYQNDIEKLKNLQLEDYQENKENKRTFITYVVFLLTVLMTIITITSIESLRGYIVVFLIVIFLVGGIVSGYIASNNFKMVCKSFIKGFISGLPAVAMILVASSAKFILEEGQVLPTIANYISILVNNGNKFVVLLLIFLIILVLEFFISSSTAKAVFVMGILSCVSIGISKELLVLAYIFGDGYTNVLFPTSPVLLIALAMTGINYTTWLKRSKWLFIITFILVFAFLGIGLLMS